MKVHQLVVMIIDFDELGATGVRQEIENARFANDCMRPMVRSVETRDIGAWSDDHPLNNRRTMENELEQLFGAPPAPTINAKEIDSGLIAAELVAVVPQWLPIETAPTDETLFLAGWTDGRICVLRGDILAAQKTRKTATPEHLQFQCTHWMPLPSAPLPAENASPAPSASPEVKP